MDLEPYLQTLRGRDRALEAERARRGAEVHARLPEVVRILVEEFGVKRVVLFGSLRSGSLHERSDLDLAVAGLNGGDYFRALDRVARAAGIDVDLVPFEEASASLRARIDSEGELLFG